MRETNFVVHVWSGFGDIGYDKGSAPYAIDDSRDYAFSRFFFSTTELKTSLAATRLEGVFDVIVVMREDITGKTVRGMTIRSAKVTTSAAKRSMSLVSWFSAPNSSLVMEFPNFSPRWAFSYA